MDGEELRFRAASELRKWVGRVRTTAQTPSWDRRDLARALGEDGATPLVRDARRALKRGDHAAAHAALARHLASRRSPFPVNARDLRDRAAVINADFPAAAAEARDAAAGILRGQLTVLGYQRLEAGNPPDWHRDPVHGARSPLAYWANVPYLDPAFGDHKIVWEINRHQHWLALARAHALTGDVRCYTAIVAQLESWMAANPPLVGTNWASMLELALRSLSWLWALEMVAPSAEADVSTDMPWLVDLLLGLDRQLTHVAQNLSRYFSPNTHLSGEALALYVAGQSLPELSRSARWRDVGRAVLLHEATRQITADGGHAELSTHYHRYSTDFYLLATAVARRAHDPAAVEFETAARRQARYLRTICDDCGRRPAIGDDDGGQLFPICGRDAADCRDTLATASVLLDDAALAVSAAPEETYWICGEPGARASSGVSVQYWPSAAMPASGYYVSRTTGGDHLIFDAGPHGFLNGGHAHADALSIVLTAGGTPLLVDPGTATYTMDAAMRDAFRDSTMHNTLVLDGRPQSAPRGPFHWRSRATASAPIWRSVEGCDFVEGTHNGYLPHRHTRAILAVHDIGWWIVDHVLGEGRPTIEIFWHLDPAWSVSVNGTTALARKGSTVRTLLSSEPLELVSPGAAPLAHISPTYGRVEPAPVVVARGQHALPMTIATFIPAGGSTPGEVGTLRPIELDSIPGPGWHAAAFRGRCGSAAMVMLTAVERTGVATDAAAAPGLCWGTADAITDGRFALLFERPGSRAEAVLVNGGRLDVRGERVIASSSGRVSIHRVPVKLAPSVHEPAAIGK